MGGAGPTGTWGGPTVHGNRGGPYGRPHARRRRPGLPRGVGVPRRVRALGPRRRLPGAAQRVRRHRGRRPGDQRRPGPRRRVRGGGRRGAGRRPLVVRARPAGPPPLARPRGRDRPARAAAPLGPAPPGGARRAGDRHRSLRARGAHRHHLLGRLPRAPPAPVPPGRPPRRRAVGGQRRRPRHPRRADLGEPVRGHGRRPRPRWPGVGGHPPRRAPATGPAPGVRPGSRRGG